MYPCIQSVLLSFCAETHFGVTMSHLVLGHLKCYEEVGSAYEACGYSSFQTVEGSVVWCLLRQVQGAADSVIHVEKQSADYSD